MGDNPTPFTFHRQAAFPFGDAGGIEGDEAGEQFRDVGIPACLLGGRAGSGRTGRNAYITLGGIAPPIRFQHGGIEFVVDELFLGCQRLAAAELFKHVVNAGGRKAGMLLLPTLAVRIEPLAEIADALLERGFFQRREWEGLEF